VLFPVTHQRDLLSFSSLLNIAFVSMSVEL